MTETLIKAAVNMVEDRITETFQTEPHRSYAV